MLPIAQLRQYVASCDPMAPLTDPESDLYVDFDAGVGLRGEGGSCMESLQHRIRLADPLRGSVQLFTGFPGTGKTTEIHRLKRALEQEPGDWSSVVLIDAQDYFDRYTPLSITDVLRVLAYHLDREATRAEGRDPDVVPGYGVRFWQLLQSDVDIKGMGFEAYGASLMAEIKDNPTFRQKAEAALQLRFQHFAIEAHEVIREAIIRLRRATGLTRVVVILDGLEKMTALTPEARAEMEESLESVFSIHAPWLRLPCHTIYTFPLWLRFRTTDLSTCYDGPALTLPMVKIRKRDGTTHTAGVDRLVELVKRRLGGDLGPVFGPDARATLVPLIEASGGYPRDLLRLVRDVISLARTFPVDAAHIERAIGGLAEEYKMVSLLANLDVAAHVALHHALPQGEAEVRAASWLFERWLVLTYRNGEEWYDLHPLVRRAEHVRDAVERARPPT